MTLWQALRYFLDEALLSLWRSWKVSSLAVLTIAVSLFVGGFFLLFSANLSSLVEQWRSRARVVVYLKPDPGAGESAPEDLRRQLAAPPWVTAVEEVSAAEARRRFQKIFPSLSELVQDGGQEPLPPSFEVILNPDLLAGNAGAGELEAWLTEAREHPRVDMIDDDRDWLADLATLITLVRAVGLGLGAVLLGAAIFTIASIIRLIAYMHHEEIAIMRLVGATEFFIRGPFYMEGALQGLLGGGLALATLFAAHRVLVARSAASAWGFLLQGAFLTWRAQLLLVLLGTAAGLIGAVVSLRRESLRDPGAEGE